MAAGKVGVSEGEYQDLCSQLQQVQSEFLSHLETVENNIEAVNCKGGGFYTDNVTPNVERLISALTDIRSMIETIYSDEMEIISNFQQAISNIDTCC